MAQISSYPEANTIIPGDKLVINQGSSGAVKLADFETVKAAIVANLGSGSMGVNVLDYGADPTGTNDSTAAIQAAINTAATGNAETSIRGARVYIPKGVYKFTTINLKRGLVLEGDGSDLTILRKTSLAASGLLFDSTGLTATGVQDHITIRGLYVWQVGLASAGAGIDIRGVTSHAQAVIEDVMLQNCYKGVELYKTILSRLTNVQVFYPIYAGIITTGDCYAATFTSCFVSTSGGAGFNLYAGNYCQIIGCAADSCFGAAYLLNNCLSCSILNCGNESNSAGAFIDTCTGTRVDNLYTSVGATTVNAIALNASVDTVMTGISAVLVTPTVATYMVASYGGQYNRVQIAHSSAAWPSGYTLGSFVEVDTPTNLLNLRTTRTDSSHQVHSLILSGATTPAINGGASFNNIPRIIAIYQSGNTFSGIGMDSSSVGVRVAGDASGLAADIGHYSTDGAYTWTSRMSVSGSTGNVTIPTGTLVVSTPATPASATAAGTIGMIKWDASYLYICTATNTWRRVAHATW